MQKPLKYRLGLDLGVSSIGSAIIKIDDDGNPLEIVDAGVRIFPVSEGASERRTNRTARKSNHRTKKRLRVLGKALYEMGLWNYGESHRISAGTKKLRATNVYELRDKALSEKLENPTHIGRIFMHLAKHRGAGYISAQQDLEEQGISEPQTDENKEKETKDPYLVLPKRLQESNLQTIGQYFWKRLCDPLGRKHIRQRASFINSEVDYAIPRYLVKDEFDKIWDTQAQYHPTMQTTGVRDKIRNILFGEHAAMPYAIGKCIYIQGEDRLATAHPLSEQRRIHMSVHNIRISEKMGKRQLTKSEIDTVIAYIMNGGTGNKTEIKELLSLPNASTVILTDAKTGIKPYFYATDVFKALPKLSALTESELIKVVEFVSNPVNENDSEKRLLNEDATIAQLISDHGGNESQWGQFLALLPKGRGNLGITATTVIIDKFSQSPACTSERAITDTLAQADPQYTAVDNRQTQLYDKLPYYGEILSTDVQPIAQWMKNRNKSLNPNELQYGKIANPAVHMMLNQLRLVVNDIIRLYGKPDAVHIEVGREVGMSAKQREEMIKEQKNNEDINIAIDKKLRGWEMPITPTNRKKLKLAQKQKFRYAFSPWDNSGIKKTFVENCEIEHLIPQSLGGTDSMANLCLVSSIENGKKGNLFPYEYFAKHKKPEEIREILKFSETLGENTAWRFNSDARERYESTGDVDETNRYMADTQYFSRLAMRYLRPIIKKRADDTTPPILAVRGRHTADLRAKWNLLGVEYDLLGWNEKYPRYLPCPHWLNKETGEISETEQQGENWKFYDKKSNPAWIAKPRIDHRHHALDAIVVGLLSRGLMQKMTTANKQGKRLKFPDPINDMDTKGEFRKYVIQQLLKINVSHKPAHGKQGKLHEAKGRTVLYKNLKNGDTITKYIRPIEEIFIHYKGDLQVEESKGKNQNESSKDKELSPPKIRQMKISQKVGSIRDKDSKVNNDLNETNEKYDQIKTAIQMYWHDACKEEEAENEKRISEGKKKQTINDRKIFAKALSIANKRSNQKIPSKIFDYEFQSDVISIERHGVAYESGSNHRMDIYEKSTKVNGEIKKKIEGEIISRFDANNEFENAKKRFTPKWKDKGYKLLYKLHIGDMLEMDTPNVFKEKCSNERCLVKVTKMSKSRLYVCLHTDAGNGDISKINSHAIKNKSRESLKDKDLKQVEQNMERFTFYAVAGTFAEHNARKIELTPFGKIKRKHKIMKNKK